MRTFQPRSQGRAGPREVGLSRLPRAGHVALASAAVFALAVQQWQAEAPQGYWEGAQGEVPGCGGGTAHAAHPGGQDHRDAASPRSSLDSSAFVVARGSGLPALQAPEPVQSGEDQQVATVIRGSRPTTDRDSTGAHQPVSLTVGTGLTSGWRTTRGWRRRSTTSAASAFTRSLARLGPFGRCRGLQHLYHGVVEPLEQPSYSWRRLLPIVGSLIRLQDSEIVSLGDWQEKSRSRSASLCRSSFLSQ